MYKLVNHPGRGSRSSVDGMITSFMGLFSLSNEEIKEIDRFIKTYWGESPPSIPKLFEKGCISYMAIYHLPLPNCEIIGVCTFRETNSYIVLENLCLKERNSNASNGFIIDCILYLKEWREKPIILYVDTELSTADTISRRFRDIRYSSNNTRKPLLTEYNYEKANRNKKIANTNIIWKNSPYSRVFVSTDDNEEEDEIDEDERAEDEGNQLNKDESNQLNEDAEKMAFRQLITTPDSTDILTPNVSSNNNNKKRKRTLKKK